MKRLLPLLIFACLTLGMGVAHGIATDRWRTSSELEHALVRLQNVPKVIGDWTSEDRVLEEGQLKVGRIKGYIYRTYTNTQTNSAVSVMIVCGRGGPISVHTPDVCYAGAGFRPTSGQELKRVPLSTEKGGPDSPFWSMKFTKPNAIIPINLEIYWAWQFADHFEAPDNSRWAYGSKPALYKMYVIREFSPTASSESNNACYEFLQRALPEIEKTLSPE